jgi:AI-2 transport protein TqsA
MPLQCAPFSPLVLLGKSMSDAPAHDNFAGDATRSPDDRRPGLASSWAVLRWLLVIATTWFLLKELAPILRPLLLAVFLAYVILPVGVYVKGHVRGGTGQLALLVGVCIAIAGLAVLAYGDIVGLSHQVPHLHERMKEIFAQATAYTRDHVPQLADAIAGTARAEEIGSSRLQQTLEGLANATAGVFIEALQVGFFLVLILLEVRHFALRMRDAFADGQADRILAMAANINAAIASYLKAKVKVNIALAVPAMLILWIFGIKFVVLWGALTFLANFVPYLGSLVACSLPIVFGFLDLGVGWQPLAAALLLLGVHLSSAYLVEPAMTGKAVDLSPLVVLIALSFWGLCWGLVGMVLAVPLTAMLKIVLQNAPSTRPIARLMGGE